MIKYLIDLNRTKHPLYTCKSANQSSCIIKICPLVKHNMEKLSPQKQGIRPLWPIWSQVNSLAPPLSVSTRVRRDRVRGGEGGGRGRAGGGEDSYTQNTDPHRKGRTYRKYKIKKKTEKQTDKQTDG